MKKFFLAAGLLGGMLLSVTPGLAQNVPSVRGLRAFSAEANYMSLPGYLRLQYFAENHTWLTHREAVAMVHRQLVASLPRR